MGKNVWWENVCVRHQDCTRQWEDVFEEEVTAQQLSPLQTGPTAGKDRSDVGHKQTNDISYLFHTNSLKSFIKNSYSVHAY